MLLNAAEARERRCFARCKRIDKDNTNAHIDFVDIRFELNGLSFVWDRNKAESNQRKHHIAFEEAAEVFFDPFFRLVDASRNEEARDAVIGCDTLGRALYVVHIEFEGEFIRIISARKATREELKHHDS